MCNLHYNKNYVIHIKALKQAMNYGLLLEEVNRVIEFNQETWLKLYINMNIKRTSSS